MLQKGTKPSTTCDNSISMTKTSFYCNDKIDGIFNTDNVCSDNNAYSILNFFSSLIEKSAKPNYSKKDYNPEINNNSINLFSLPKTISDSKNDQSEIDGKLTNQFSHIDADNHKLTVMNSNCEKLQTNQNPTSSSLILVSHHDKNYGNSTLSANPKTRSKNLSSSPFITIHDKVISSNFTNNENCHTNFSSTSSNICDLRCSVISPSGKQKYSRNCRDSIKNIENTLIQLNPPPTSIMTSTLKYYKPPRCILTNTWASINITSVGFTLEEFYEICHSMRFAEFDPSKFKSIHITPIVVLLRNPVCCCLIYRNGKLQIMGFVNETQAEKQARKVTNYLRKRCFTLSPHDMINLQNNHFGSNSIKKPKISRYYKRNGDLCKEREDIKFVPENFKIIQLCARVDFFMKINVEEFIEIDQMKGLCLIQRGGEIQIKLPEKLFHETSITTEGKLLEHDKISQTNYGLGLSVDFYDKNIKGYLRSGRIGILYYSGILIILGCKSRLEIHTVINFLWAYIYQCKNTELSELDIITGKNKKKKFR